MSSSPRASDGAWSALVKTALLGTERSELPGLPAGTPSADLVAQIAPQDKEAALLSAAAVTHLHARCGTMMPSFDASAAEVSGAEELQCCSAAAGRFIVRMLHGECLAALPEFLSALEAAKLRVPEEHLADLLDRGKKDSKLRPLLAPVAGRRGAWLALQNTDWDYLGETIDKESWLTSAHASRLLFLESLRKSDPTQARELLAASWPEESGDHRAAFLGTFMTGLSAADETFLEAALDDRKKEVRRTAFELLAHLSGSAWQQRMTARLLPCIKVQRSSGLAGFLKKKPVLQITLPEVCDAAMQRDGVELKPTQGQGEKSWWLGQMLALVSPAILFQHLEMTTEEAVEAAVQSDWKELFFAFWASGARLHGDRKLAEALFAHGLESLNATLLDLVNMVSSEVRNNAILDALKKDREQLGYNHTGLRLLRQCPAPWDERVVRGTMQLLREQAAKILDGKLNMHWHWLPEPENFAFCIPVSLASEVEAGWPSENLPPVLTRSLSTMLEMLKFRSQMLKEIHP